MMETKGLSREKSFLHSRMTKKNQIVLSSRLLWDIHLCD